MTDVPPVQRTPAFPLALIAAVARNGIIGADNGLPWRLPSDLRHFRDLTMGQPTLMGRRTYQSIGRPLPGRHVIVLSGDRAFAPAGVHLARTLAEALDLAAAVGREHGARETMVAGGGMLYAALIGVAQRLYITRVACDPPGDVGFPPIDPAQWRQVTAVPGVRTPRDEADFATLTFERTAKAPS